MNGKSDNKNNGDKEHDHMDHSKMDSGHDGLKEHHDHHDHHAMMVVDFRKRFFFR